MSAFRSGRRSILGGIGLGTATLFARPLLRNAQAQAGGGRATPPARLLVVCMPNCSIKARWAPTGGRNVVAGSGDAAQFQWGFCNEPLESVRQYVTLVDGLDHKAVGGDPHGSGFIRYTTGGTIRAGEGARDPGAGRLPGDGNLPVMGSVDQLFLQKSAIIGDKGLPIPGGLQLAVDTRGRTDGIHFITMSYTVEATPKPMPPENTPFKTYARIVQVAGPGSSAPEQQAGIMRQLAKDKSVLDFLISDLGRLNGRLGVQQRTKLESHLDGLREYETSLMRRSAAASGAVPAAPAAGGGMGLPASIEMVAPNSNVTYTKIWEQYHDLVKLAFQLDLVRTATILYGHGNNAWNGLHSTAHGGSADKLANGTRQYMEMTAAYVKRLSEVTDFDGAPLIDNMVMTLSSDVSERHNHVNVPYLVVGGKNLGVKGGRVLRAPGRASNDVFSSLAPCFKVELPGGKFGDEKHAQGPLPELVG